MGEGTDRRNTFHLNPRKSATLFDVKIQIHAVICAMASFRNVTELKSVS